jgi:hypothetical protein
MVLFLRRGGRKIINVVSVGLGGVFNIKLRDSLVKNKVKTHKKVFPTLIEYLLFLGVFIKKTFNAEIL